MKAAIYKAFQGPVSIQEVPDPVPGDHGVVLRVGATGLCRSDWHGWMGHDADIRLPHVPGHELAGTVTALGKDVHKWREGDRVTLPFVCACGDCPQCESGNQQVCDHQFQPGFTAWGSFAEYVAIDYADGNLVALPESIDFVSAASLGCRFVTSFRAVVDQGKLLEGQWLAVHGAGGVGLSAIMIGKALGAQVVAVDIDAEKLAFAKSLGADVVIDAQACDVVSAVRDETGGGAHVSLDALGSAVTCYHSVANLRKRGKHVQVGLLLAEEANTAVPMDKVVAWELEILGSHGIQAHRYGELLAMIKEGKLAPEKLVGQTINLQTACTALTDMNSFRGTGVTVIDAF